MTAEVLSWVMTCVGWMETKSPARSGRSGPSARWACASFSTMVWGMNSCQLSVASCQWGRRAGPFRLQQLHQLTHRTELVQLPHRFLHPLACGARHHRRGQRVEFLLDLAVAERIPRVALRIIQLLGELAPVGGA